MTIFGGVCTVIIILFMPETYMRELLVVPGAFLSTKELSELTCFPTSLSLPTAKRSRAHQERDRRRPIPSHLRRCQPQAHPEGDTEQDLAQTLHYVCESLAALSSELPVLTSTRWQVQEPMLFILTMYLALVYGIICESI